MMKTIRWKGQNEDWPTAGVWVACLYFLFRCFFAVDIFFFHNWESFIEQANAYENTAGAIYAIWLYNARRKRLT